MVSSGKVGLNDFVGTNKTAKFGPICLPDTKQKSKNRFSQTTYSGHVTNYDEIFCPFLCSIVRLTICNSRTWNFQPTSQQKSVIFGDFAIFSQSKLERCAKKSMIPLVYSRVSTCSRNCILQAISNTKKRRTQNLQET